MGIAEVTFSVERGQLPLALPGLFKPWSIEVGHSKILLRGFHGDPESEYPPRVFDVLFQDVSRISLADRYSDLCLTVAESGLMRSEEERVGGDWGGSRMFLMNPENPVDYVVASYIFWAEVLVRGSDPSPLMEEVVSADSIPGSLFRA